LAASDSLAGEKDADFRAAASLYLGVAWLFALTKFDRFDEAREILEQGIAACRASQPGAESAEAAIELEPLYLLLGDRAGLRVLEAAELLPLIRGREPGEGNANFWYELSNWAFKNDSLPLLEEAYAHFTIRRPTQMAEWTYRRTRMLLLLRRGHARTADLRACIAACKVSAELEDVEEVILPHCRAAGIVSEELELELEEKRAALSKLAVQVPEYGS
jgi:hypothetical protein